MPFPDTLADPQYAVPAAADGGAITAVAATDTDSAWVTLLASAPANGILTGITVRPTGIVFFGWQSTLKIEIGVGASPTVIATFTAAYDSRFFGEAGSQGLYIPCPIGIEGIVSGQPIKARLRQSSNLDTQTWHVSATYLRLPLTGAITSTANPLFGFPGSGLQVLTFSGPGWSNSSWSTLAVGGDRVVLGVVVVAGGAGQSTNIDIGDTTTVRATIPVYEVTTLNAFPDAIPITPIRVTGDLRIRARANAGAGLVYVGLVTVDYPL